MPLGFFGTEWKGIGWLVGFFLCEMKRERKREIVFELDGGPDYNGVFLEGRGGGRLFIRSIIP